MKSLIKTTQSAEETMKLGESLAQLLKPGDILCLSGNLGSGKTTFVKGLAKGLAIDQTHVNSPTFVIMNSYEVGRLPLYHFDFYRLDNSKEVAMVGFEEFLYGKGIAVIEWSERFGELMPTENLTIEFLDAGDQKRNLRFIPHGKRYDQLFPLVLAP